MRVPKNSFMMIQMMYSKECSIYFLLIAIHQMIKYLIIVAINACMCGIDISIYCVTKISPDQPPTSNLHVSSPPTQHCDYHHNVSTPSQDSLHVTSNSLSTSSITPNLQCQLRMSTRQQLCWHFGLD